MANIYSYLFHLGDRADNLYGFTQQVALLESLFSAEDGSFIGYDLISKQPLFFEENGNKRQGFVNQLHCGVLKYCEDAIFFIFFLGLELTTISVSDKNRLRHKFK